MSQTSFTVPTTYQNAEAGITNPGNAVAQDDAYAVWTSSTASMQVDTFGFSIPSNAIITGIEVEIQVKATSPGGSPSASAALSWDDGDTTTSSKDTTTLTASEQTLYLGGPGDLWGRSWTYSEFNDG